MVLPFHPHTRYLPLECLAIHLVKGDVTEYVMDLCVMELCVMDLCVMDLCVMDLCVMDLYVMDPTRVN